MFFFLFVAYTPRVLHGLSPLSVSRTLAEFEHNLRNRPQAFEATGSASGRPTVQAMINKDLQRSFNVEDKRDVIRCSPCEQCGR